MMNRNLLLPAVLATVSVLSLAAIFPAVIAVEHGTGGAMFGDDENNTKDSNNNETSTGTSAMNETSTAEFIMDNGTLDCKAIAQELGGIGVPSGNVCDVVVVRQSPQITGDNGLNLNQFTLMNSVLEFLVMPANTSTSTTMTANISSGDTGALDNSTSQSGLFGNETSNGNTTTAAQEVYVMGDFALLETEMNDVLTVVKDNGWTVTGIHNHMINEDPKTTFMHWEAQGDINEIIEQANQAFEKTSIKG
jgi:hypothetical protein